MNREFNTSPSFASCAALLALCFVGSTSNGQQIRYGDYLPANSRINEIGKVRFEPEAAYIVRGQNDALPPPVRSSVLVSNASFSGAAAVQQPAKPTQKSGPKCNDCGKAECDCCCPLPNCCCCPQTSSVYGEYLLLHATGVDMVYGIPQDGIGAPGTAPIGRVGTLDHTYESGVRIGLRKCLSECAAVHLSYTWFESVVNDAIQVAGSNVINPVMFVPTIANAGDNAQRAEGQYNIRFQVADADYRYRWNCGAIGHLDVVLGARYASLRQDITATYRFAPPDSTTVTNTNIDFDGGGLRIGLDGERYVHGCSRLKVYGKGFASVLSGSFKSDYIQTSQFNGTEAVVQWEDDRFVPILEGELGLTIEHGHFRIAAGYQMSAWFNAVTTPVFVDAVKAGNYTNVQDTITFDGLVGRVEFIW